MSEYHASNNIKDVGIIIYRSYHIGYQDYQAYLWGLLRLSCVDPPWGKENGRVIKVNRAKMAIKVTG